MPENNRRYTDKGMEPDQVQDTLGALKRKLEEGETFIPRATDEKKLKTQIEAASKEFELKAVSVVEENAPDQQDAEPTQDSHPVGDSQPQDGGDVGDEGKEATVKKNLIILLSKSPHSPEHRKYIETAVGSALPSVKKSFENAGITIPTDDEILQQMIMTNRFRPEQIKALIRTIQTQGLIILPPQMKAFTDHERFLNSNKKRRRQSDVFVRDSRRTAFAAQDEKLQKAPASTYRFGLGETAQELGNRSGKLMDIVTKWQDEDLAKVLRVPTPREYAMLQGQAPDLLDLKGWSFLCEETEPHNIIGDDNRVSGGDGYYSWRGDDRVNFDDFNPERDFSNARVRPVMVE